MGLYFDQQKQSFRVHLTSIKALGRKRISRLLPRAYSREQAQAVHDRMQADLHNVAYLPNREAGWDDYIEVAAANKASWFHSMLQRSRRHAAARNRTHVLSENQLKFICLRSGGRCEVTGIKFSDERLKGNPRQPFRHSLDRIDSTKGYSIDNCRLVLMAVNIAMSAWGEEVLREVAVGYVINKFCAPGLVGYMKKTTI